MSRPRIATWSAAAALSLAVTAVMVWPMRDFPLLGWDTYPLVASSRIRDFGDFLGTFTEDASDGVYPFSFYRPVLSLSLAVDYAIWGIEPLGFVLGDARAFLLCALATFALARRWLGPGSAIGQWVTLGVFLIQPVHAEILPLPSRRMDVICGSFVALCLWSELGRGRRPGPRAWALPVACTVLAVGAKEAGVMTLPLVFLLAWTRSLEPGPVGRLLEALRRAMPHAVAIGGVFVARFAAIGGLGGHGTTDLMGSVTRITGSLSAIVQRLSHLQIYQRQLHEGPGAQAIGAVIVVLGIAALWALARRPGEGDASRRSRASSLALVSLPWIVGLGGIYGTVGVMQPWYLLLPAQALCLLAGAGAQLAWEDLRDGRRGRALAAAAPLAIWLGFSVAWSPLARPVTHWQRTAVALSRYEADLFMHIVHAKNGSVLYGRKPPRLIAADDSPVSSIPATGMNAYSLPSWLELHFPERRIEVVVEEANELGRSQPRPIADGVLVVLRDPPPRGDRGNLPAPSNRGSRGASGEE
jgi:hypothetical protein